MTKKDDNSHETVQTKQEETKSKPPQSPSTQKRRKAKRSRKVKFADPLAEQRLYDRALSPNAETTETIKLKDTNINLNTNANNTKLTSAIQELQPPLSLVASLEMAAKTLNVRPSSKIADDKETSLKTIKSTKSTKSLIQPKKEPVKSPIKKAKD